MKFHAKPTRTNKFSSNPCQAIEATLDTETATLPFANEIANGNQKIKKDIAIAKPLVYDIGWVVHDRNGNIYKKVNYLVQETFFVPSIFNTAYYCNKRQLYMDMLARGEIKVACWNDIMAELIDDLMGCDFVQAYNACFDFKKAIPYTENYISALYSDDYNEWERKQRYSCQRIARGNKNEGSNPEYLIPVFKLRDIEIDIIDLWGLACDRLINIDRYRDYCLTNGLLTESAMFFKTSAETSFQYLMKKHDFVESHTALDDALIEMEISVKAMKKGKIEPYLKAFPFRDLGYTHDYALEKRKKYIPTVAQAYQTYLDTHQVSTRYASRINNILVRLGA